MVCEISWWAVTWHLLFTLKYLAILSTLRVSSQHQATCAAQNRIGRDCKHLSRHAAPGTRCASLEFDLQADSFQPALPMVLSQQRSFFSIFLAAVVQSSLPSAPCFTSSLNLTPVTLSPLALSHLSLWQTMGPNGLLCFSFLSGPGALPLVLLCDKVLPLDVLSVGVKSVMFG